MQRYLVTPLERSLDLLKIKQIAENRVIFKMDNSGLIPSDDPLSVMDSEAPT